MPPPSSAAAPLPRSRPRRSKTSLKNRRLGHKGLTLGEVVEIYQGQCRTAAGAVQGRVSTVHRHPRSLGVYFHKAHSPERVLLDCMVCLVEHQQAAGLQVEAQTEQADEAAGGGDEDAGGLADQRDALSWGGVVPVQHLAGEMTCRGRKSVHTSCESPPWRVRWGVNIPFEAQVDVRICVRETRRHVPCRTI